VSEDFNNPKSLEMTRIVFIHGFGENESIFKNIAPHIGGNQHFINVWDELGNARQDDMNVMVFAEKMTKKYSINAQDLVIGHSMGGWIAYHIKHFTGCRIVQIGSWTHFDRVLSPIRTGSTIYWMVRNGLYINRFQKWLFVRLNYKNNPSRQTFEEVFEDLIQGNKENVISQLRMIFEPVASIEVKPDLRIHARRDAVIKYPREAFVEVPGDHFTLITYPETVWKPIVELLNQ
jgi:hypothetical protein